MNHINFEGAWEAMYNFAEELKKMSDKQELKVGDKVRVKDDADLAYVCLDREDFKSPYGEVISRDDLCEDGWDVLVHFEDIDDERWFTEEMLEKVAEKEPKQIIFSPSQVRSAAQFLHINNKFLDKPVEFFEDLIFDTIKEKAYSGTTYVGTAGFYVMFSEDDGGICADVLVSPDVSEMSEYLSAELKDGKLVVEY